MPRRKRSFSSTLFRAARAVDDVEAVEHKRGGRRLRNVALGRLLGSLGVWKGLWR